MSSRIAKQTSYVLLLSVFSFFILTSCDGVETQNRKTSPEMSEMAEEEGNFLVGTWEAEWNTSSESFQVDDPKALKMQGKIDFEKNGQVKIVAYGFDGCIFMTDTMTNELKYSIKGDTINLHAEDDNFGLPYQIKEKKPNLVRLLLMEDIWLTLKRPGEKIAENIR